MSRCIRFILLFSTLLMCLGIAPTAGAALRLDGAQADPRREMRVWFDPSGTVEAREALAHPVRFQAIPPGQGDELNFGYRQGAVWLRVEVARGPDAPADWLLEIGYPTLDRVDVFLADAAGGLIHQRLGDRQPASERPFSHRNLIFPLTFAPEATQTLLLRVASEGNLTIPVHLWRPEALAAHDRHAYAALSLYFGALLALLIYNFLLYLPVRDTLYLLYCGVVVGMGLGQLSLNGLGNLWLWPDWPLWGHYALPAGFGLCGLSAALFTRRFLDSAHYAPLLDRWVRAMAWVFALLLLAAPVLSYRVFGIGISISGLVFSLLAVFTAIQCLRRGSPGARWFLLAWVLLLLGVGITAARNMSWLPTNTFTSYIMQIGSALEMLLLSFALADRINLMRRQKEAAEAGMLATRREMYAVLERQEAELETRVAERTRELERINASLRESEARQHELATHDPLTGLANRLLLDDRLAQALRRAKREDWRLGVALIDLDKFKPINDGFGHGVGDLVLAGVAERLRAAVRKSDTVARYGGDEFVLVLENIGGREGAELCLAGIRAALEPPMAVAGQVFDVSASIGLSLFPEDGDDASTLLRQADQAMYDAKRARRAGHDPY